MNTKNQGIGILRSLASVGFDNVVIGFTKEDFDFKKKINDK